MSPRSFGDLAPELVLSVMRCLESPKDLFNFIRTSRTYHQIFEGSKAGTLEAVIRNAIPSLIMPDALAACEAAEVSKLWWKHFPSDGTTTPPPPSASFQASRKRFIDAYSRRSIPASFRGNGQPLSLLKLWRIADKFLLDFQNYSLVFAAKSFPCLQPDWDKPISAAERTRFLRALFRFEVFRRLFPEVSTTGSDARNKRDFVQFLHLFSPWEREELLSVHEYLVSFTKDIYRELQDYLLDRLRCIGDEMKHDAEVQGAQLEREELKDISMALDLGGLDVFQSCRSLTGRRFQYLVSRGLPFLSWLANLAPNERMLTLDVSHASDCHCSLFELTYRVFDRLSSSNDPVAPTTTTANESFGWRWARHNGLVSGSNQLLKRYILRQAGFVFWDAERLIAGWRLPEAFLDTISLPSRDQDDDDHDWNKEPSLEERFENVAVPKGFFSDEDEGRDEVFRARDGFFGEFEVAFPPPFSQEETTRFAIEY